MDTSILSHINWLAVAVATVAYFLAGAIWYHKNIFGTHWARGHGINMNDENAKKGMARTMIMAFGSFAVITIALAVLVAKLQLGVFMSGVKLGVVTGIGFSWMTMCISYLYTQKPMSLHLIDGIFHTIGQVIVAVILCLWK
jgi:preprotein translocase subunit SecG